MKERITVLLTIFIFAYGLSLSAQHLEDEIAQFRQNQVTELFESAKPPLKKDEIRFLSYFAPDGKYRLEAAFRPEENARPFLMTTSTGSASEYVKYGTVTFYLDGHPHRLAVYRSLTLPRIGKYRDYLFVPFRDKTNGKETYGGGRYLDLRAGDIRNGTVVLDFNKAYNPYCAYSPAFSCPIPPSENRLKARIEAGEKIFKRK